MHAFQEEEDEMKTEWIRDGEILDFIDTLMNRGVSQLQLLLDSTSGSSFVWSVSWKEEE